MKKLFPMVFVFLYMVAFNGNVQGQIWSTGTYMGAVLERSHDVKKVVRALSLPRTVILKLFRMHLFLH